MVATGSSAVNIPLSVLTDILVHSQVWKSTVDKCTALELEYKVLSRQQDIDTLSDHRRLSNPKCPLSLRNDLLHTEHALTISIGVPMPEVREFPENTQHIHIMGVGGTAMAALAGLLVAKGYKVTGRKMLSIPQ